ncbi:Bifunctional inhibitor/plant lipid transfer protein/seed storage helical domain [Dillenia turbinata]|uniref:Bifunctional inhibitor/plant lipid transfer protein/seed storage helical domain n=1 Tax=Dillenia turbinata TaxID=194707 RepID=A0AAN8W304_9MAGN
MASRGIEMCLALALVSLYWASALAQLGCTSALMGLSPCLNYVNGNSPSPSSSCCSQLSNIVQSQPVCLCSLLSGGSSSLGITINQTRALELPGACDVKTPPVSQCNAVNGSPSPATTPVPAPESSPAGSSNENPATSTTPSSSSGEPTTTVPSASTGSDSKTTPTTSTSSDGTILKPFQLSVLGLFIASFASIFVKF